MGAEPLRVVLEVGTRWVFACALDWPGWARRGRDESSAVQALLDYAERYRPVAGASSPSGEVAVVGRVPGNATTDFGAPAVAGPWDDEPLPAAEAERQADLLGACWRCFDAAVARAPARLRKGPRGGGRDRDDVVDHVREAERAYGRKMGLRLPPRTPWPEQREALRAALLGPSAEAAWPPRYACRRVAWHVLDHAWEVEDRSG